MVDKVLDYTRRVQTSDAVGTPRELAVRCDGFRVTLPSAADGATLENPFERVVLRLLDLRRYSALELATEACLHEDLTRFILLRLAEQGFIDERHDLLDRGRAALGKLQRAAAAEVSYRTFVVFRERINGRLLPMLVAADDLPVQESENRDGLVVFVGTKSFRLNTLGRGSRSSQVPTAAQVEAVLSRMAQRARVLGHRPPTSSLEHGILITSEPEPYLLRCQLVVQRFDSDWRITDPFGQGYSVDLETAYRDLLNRDESEAKQFDAWQGRIAAQADPRPVPGVAPAQTTFGDLRNEERYPELVRALWSRNWYGAVEWALFYLNHSHDLTRTLQLVKVRLASVENEKAVLQAAQDLGLVASDVLPRGLVDLRPGRVNAYLRGDASMTTVLPLALLSAAQNPGHPFLSLAEEMPNLLEVVAYLKNQRGDRLHRRTGARVAESPLSSPEEEWAKQIVHALLPSVTFDGDTENTSVEATGAVDDRLDARLALQSEFGRSTFAGWPTDVQDNLLAVEVTWLSLCDGKPFDGARFFNELATATQSAFRAALDRAKLGNSGSGDPVATASDRALRHGFGPLPDRLSTVRPPAIEKSLHGGFGTLGSVVVAYLVRAEESDLIRLERHRTTLLADLDRLIQLRDHTNRRVETTRHDCGALRRGIYTTIRSLLES